MMWLICFHSVLDENMNGEGDMEQKAQGPTAGDQTSADMVSWTEPIQCSRNFVGPSDITDKNSLSPIKNF